jgi:hypothetical protein
MTGKTLCMPKNIGLNDSGFWESNLVGRKKPALSENQKSLDKKNQPILRVKFHRAKKTSTF